jgi:hypothetical protein
MCRNSLRLKIRSTQVGVGSSPTFGIKELGQIGEARKSPFYQGSTKGEFGMEKDRQARLTMLRRAISDLEAPHNWNRPRKVGPGGTTNKKQAET